ncbi:hypothetical protein ACFVZD_14750 [Streptomyces sp. NPDC058287]|uniref:hypothetical protein n=1 Tax=unclassified Streptomyces TaxID=2593676 RepID=UPI0036E52350
MTHGQMLELAHSGMEVIEFLHRAGLPKAEMLLDEPAWVRWRGGGAHHYEAAQPARRGIPDRLSPPGFRSGTASKETSPRTASSGVLSSSPSSATSLGVQLQPFTAPATNSGEPPSRSLMCFSSPSRYSAAYPCGKKLPITGSLTGLIRRSPVSQDRTMPHNCAWSRWERTTRSSNGTHPPPAARGLHAQTRPGRCGAGSVL